MLYGPEPERTSSRRQLTVALAFLLAALALAYVPLGTQERISSALRASLLRPFIETQVLLADLRRQRADVDELRRLVDSLSAALSARGGLADENRRLRELLGIALRLGPSFIPATVLRAGTSGSQSTFFVDVGSLDGVQPGAPVLTHQGLLGAIREVQPGMSVGMDWTHPDFRASAMIEGGVGYGIVENRRGPFREGDRMVLNGTPYNESFPIGARVVTSGMGVYPRGIPIGLLQGVVEDPDRDRAGWLKVYWLDPMVDPPAATHVLVMTGGSPAEVIEQAWAPDTVGAATPLPTRIGRR